MWMFRDFASTITLENSTTGTMAAGRPPLAVCAPDRSSSTLQEIKANEKKHEWKKRCVCIGIGRSETAKGFLFTGTLAQPPYPSNITSTLQPAVIISSSDFG